MRDSTLEEVLAKLRDIHGTPSVSFWPPAPGWIALIVMIMSIALIAFFIHRYRTRIRRHVLKKIVHLRQDPFSPQSVAALSTLLRRVALYLFPRCEVAGLEGAQWIAFLNRTGQTEKFSTPIGQYLITGPYQRALTSENKTELYSLVEDWVRKNL